MANKRFQKEIDKFKYKGEHTPFSLGTLCVVALCLLLIIVSTFTEFDFIRFWINKSNGSVEFLPTNFIYVAQVPAVIFTIAILGARYSILTLLIYLILGLFVWPIFAFGGGISYVKLYVFAYILAYFPSVFAVSFILKRFKNVWGNLLASFTGVFTTHFTGFVLSFFYVLFKTIDFQYLYATSITLGITKFIYDFLFGFLVILLAKPVKSIFWIAMRNDIVKEKRKIKTKKENS